MRTSLWIFASFFVLISSSCFLKKATNEADGFVTKDLHISKEVAVEVNAPIVQQEAIDFHLSWFEGKWFFIQNENSFDENEYLNIRFENEKYLVDLYYQGSHQKGFLYKNLQGKPPYNYPGVFIETDQFVFDVTVTYDKFYVYNKALVLHIYDIDFATCQKEEIVYEVQRNNWWEREVVDN